MKDLKLNNRKKLKSNRRKQEKQPRDWKQLFHRLLRIGIASGSGFLLASGALLTVQMLLESGYFGVKLVRVEQQVRVSEGDILDASDIKLGDSLFDLELHMIGRKIEEHPWIARAEVERSFPDQVVIRVVERQARAIIDLDYLYYVDRKGVAFKMLESGDELDYPVITGIDRQYLLDHPDQTQNSLDLALSLMDQLEQRKLFNLDDVSEIHFDQQEGLIIYTRIGGVPVRMGKENFYAKLDRFEAIYEDLEPRLLALKYIDLNVTDRVIVKVDVKRTTGRS
ncbi:MAG: FtsQ-type POTRA domain-containing protein [Deltaproteobacteria bacterium]|jgi:cell division protein FtsQ|nr:FtsQ-type POTRA domain-containing protein [Deltaproteobacteria bacterium]MDH4007500.1 FtsQ-type POTRA domain-containing protein [Desulfuromonadales bacterium]